MKRANFLKMAVLFMFWRVVMRCIQETMYMFKIFISVFIRLFCLLYILKLGKIKKV